MTSTLFRNRWMFVPIALLGATIAFCTITVLLAVADHPLGVEPQYDAKAAAWQATAAQRAENDRLRWIITPVLERLDGQLASIAITVEDRHTIPIDVAQVAVECIPIANADSRSLVTLVEARRGVYRGAFPVSAEGWHEFRVSVHRSDSTYTDSFRRVVPTELARP